MRKLSLLAALAIPTLIPLAAQTVPQPSSAPVRQATLGKAPLRVGPAQVAKLPSLQDQTDLFTTEPLSVNTSIRRATRNFYNAVYPASDGIASEWTGSVTGDVPGTTSSDFKDAVTLRVNWMRAQAGVPAAITLNSAWSAEDQQAALMMSANNTLDHTPPSTWIDYTAQGADAAGHSNLALGYEGPDAITGYIDDNGSNNAEVGHRRWVLYPPTELMGTGDVSLAGSYEAANALWVFDSAYAYPTLRDGFVAWPPKGYVPYQLVFPRWSFSLLNADFSHATVSVTLKGVSVGTVISSSTDDGYGDNTLVWTLTGTPDGSPAYPAPASDTTYTVNVGNVVVSGATHSYSYAVTVFNPSVAGTDDIFPTLTGSASVAEGTSNSYAFTTVPEATNYDFWSAPLQTVTWIEGAETVPPVHLTPQTTGTYSPINTTTSASGSNCFQLCQDEFLDQDLLMNSEFVASASSAISFQTRYGYMTTDQVAEVQVSTDDGNSWTTVFSRAGNNADTGSFALQSVSLSAYANRIIRIRFLLYFPGTGTAFTQTGQNNIGWLIDSIAPQNMTEAISPTVSTSTGTPATFVAPNATGTEGLAVRGLLFNTFPLEYGPVKSVTVTVPTNLTAQTITFPVIANKTAGVAPFSTGATASSGLAVTYTTTGPVKISGNTVTVTGAGSISIRAHQNGNAIYAAAPSILRSFTVSKASQTITFTPVSNRAFSATSFHVAATASSGLAVTYRVVSGPATLVNNLVTLIGVGTVVLGADQAGNADYNAATEVMTSFMVTAATQTITFPAIGTQTYPGGPITLRATASSGLTVTYRNTGPAKISGNVLTITGTGSVLVAASQSGNAGYAAAPEMRQTFTVTAP